MNIKNTVFIMSLLIGGVSYANASTSASTSSIVNQNNYTPNIQKVIAQGVDKEKVASICAIDKNIYGSHLFLEFCLETVKDLDLIQPFEQDMSEWDFHNSSFKLPPFRTLLGNLNAQKNFYDRVGDNKQYISYFTKKRNEANEKFTTLEEKKAYLKTEMNAFIKGGGVNISDKEFDNLKALWVQIKKSHKEALVFGNELEFKIKQEFAKNESKLLTYKIMDEIFKTKEINTSINGYESKIDLIMKDKETLVGFYEIVNTGRIDEIVKALKENKTTSVTKKECLIIEKLQIMSKEGLKALVCKD